MRSRYCLILAGPVVALALGVGAPRAVLAAAPTAGAPRVSLTQLYPHGYIEATLSPGQTLTTALVVADGGSVPGDFLITAVDGYTSSASGVVYGNRRLPLRDGPSGNGEYGAGRWIVVSTPGVHLNPGQSQTVTVTVTVPAATPPGDWAGGITAENPVATPSNNGATQLNITEATGMAVIIHVPGPTSSGAMSIGQPSIVAQASRQFLDIPLRYTGDVLVKPLYSFTLTDSHGHVVLAHSGRFDTFVPHTTLIYEVLLDPPAGVGTYSFVGSAGPDGNVITVRDTVTVSALPVALPTPPSQGGVSPGPVTRPPLNPLSMVAPIILAALLALLAVVARRRRNRCSHCGRGRVGGLMTVGDFQEIAHCHDCRARALEREDVRLCPECYRGHVLPSGGLNPRTA